LVPAPGAFDPYEHIMITNFFIFLAVSSASLFPFSEKNFKKVMFPGFPSQHSSWESIGYSKKHHRVVIGVSEHHDSVAIFVYDVAKDKMELGNWVMNGGNLLRPYQWQGKIHSPMIDNPFDNKIYFGTDAGLERWVPYSGGYMMRFDALTYELENLGLAHPGESVKVLSLDLKRQQIQIITSGSDFFITKDIKTKESINHGVLNKKYIGRQAFSDDWGNFYYLDTRGHVMKFEAATGEFVFGEEPLPAEEIKGDSKWRDAFGYTAWTRYKKTNDYYFITYTHRVFKFNPQEKGVGPTQDLGLIYKGSESPKDTVIENGYTPNLVCGLNEKLYYWVGGHGMALLPDTSVLIEMDPKTKKTEILVKLYKNELIECTGSNIIDKEGTMYYTARKYVEGRDVGESGSSVPYLMMVNPTKELR